MCDYSCFPFLCLQVTWHILILSIVPACMVLRSPVQAASGGQNQVVLVYPSVKRPVKRQGEIDGASPDSDSDTEISGIHILLVLVFKHFARLFHLPFLINHAWIELRKQLVLMRISGTPVHHSALHYHIFRTQSFPFFKLFADFYFVYCF